MTENEYLLTVAIPTYNGSRTIGAMLDILLPQVTKEVEVIISDNCSTDNTPDIIKKYVEKFPFIKYVQNKRNINADGNFLQCMRMAKGKFVMLTSDDDIVIEGAIEKITNFLKKHLDMSLGYMEALAFKDKYVSVERCHGYKFLTPVEESFVTTDKDIFLKYCQRLFGFTSVHIWSTERIKQIENPEQYFGTYFLQGYINVLCSNRPDDILGVIKGPCIGVGEYGIIGNFDVAEVEGIYNHRMIEFAIANGYPKQRMEKFYIWKAIFLCRNSIIRERAVDLHKTSIKNIFKATIKYPSAWIKLYPFLLVPAPICKLALRIIRKKQGRKFLSYVNRPTSNNDGTA